MVEITLYQIVDNTLWLLMMYGVTLFFLFHISQEDIIKTLETKGGRK